MAYKNIEDRRAYSKLHYEENKELYKLRAKNKTKETKEILKQYIKEYLLDHPCVDCGNADIRVLEFDHVKDKKLANIADIPHRGWALKKLKEEINKCEIRCANCHRIVTHERRN